MNIDIQYWRELTQSERLEVLTRPAQGLDQEKSRVNKVNDIIQEVKRNGDQSLVRFAKEFDKVDLQSLVYNQTELSQALETCEPKLKKALLTAKRNIEVFHGHQTPTDYRVEPFPGIHCERRFRAIEKVGLYAPGGSAPLVSAVLMLAIPAKMAGCKERVMITPPGKDGKVPQEILAAAALCEVSTLVCSGGAQAIAALAYGTETVPKVDKIYGPGNSWVTEAKLQVSSDPKGAAFDSPAGPSEVLVIVDKDSDAQFAAADLLSQAEHGPDSQVVLLSTCEEKTKELIEAIASQLQELPRREIAEQALRHSVFLQVDDLMQAIEVSNAYAPEHLIIHPEASEQIRNQITNAGSVFLGPYSPESVGDYASGTNHVLPTYGYANVYSGLSVDDFRKSITYQELTKDGLLGIAETVEVLAAFEGLKAHEHAVALRRISLQKECQDGK